MATEARKAEEERLQRAIAAAEEERAKKEEEERARKEHEQKAKEEAERKQAELDEKIRKEEEERLARKKRLEEIMARTRGGNKSKSSQDSPQPPPAATAAAVPPAPEESAAASTESNGEKKPESVEAVASNGHNGHNGVTQNNHCSEPAEEAAAAVTEDIAQNELKSKPDLLSDTNEKNQMNSLTDFDPFGGAATKTSPQEVTDNGESDVITGTDEQDVECHEEPVFDQILDLSCEKVAGGGGGESASTMAGSQVMIGAPIIAFEDANSSGTVPTAATTSIPNQVEVPTGDLLS